MRRHAGPNPGVVAVVFAVLFLTGLAFVTNLFDSTHFPSPLQPAAEIEAYFATRMVRVALCAALQFGAAIPLGVYTATMTSRLRFHGVRAAGIEIASFGGAAAAIMMLVSAAGQWALSRPGVADDGHLARAIYDLVFVVGGPGYTVPLGILCAGIAVPALLSGQLSRRLAWAGIALAVIGELSVVSLVIPGALFLVPLTRFPAFVWLAWAGFQLAPTRGPAPARAPEPA